MSGWHWFHKWETVSHEKHNLVRPAQKDSVIGELHIFHERCTICGTNNVKTFRAEAEE